MTRVKRLLYGSLSAVQCLLWLLYGAVWVDKHRVIIIEHRRPSCLHLTVTDLELRLHNTVSNPHSRIESFLHYKYSQHMLLQQKVAAISTQTVAPEGSVQRFPSF